MATKVGTIIAYTFLKESYFYINYRILINASSPLTESKDVNSSIFVSYNEVHSLFMTIPIYNLWGFKNWDLKTF